MEFTMRLIKYFSSCYYEQRNVENDSGYGEGWGVKG